MANPVVLVCSSAWKETLSPVQANAILIRALKASGFAVEIQNIPLSDGGDGFLDAVLTLPLWADAQRLRLTVTGPLPHQLIQASYLWLESSLTLVVEAAEIHGMKHLPGGQRDPIRATSYGVGEALSHLLKQHPQAQTLVLSLGGSASVEGGFGFLQALGWQFIGPDGQRITEPIGGGALLSTDRVIPAETPVTLSHVRVLTDVTTVYRDAPRIFGPQKGADSLLIESLTHAFTRLSSQVGETGASTSSLPGTGAAGGLSWAILQAFPHARLTSGMAWLDEQWGLEPAVKSAALVLTGEGCLDETSFLGKGTGYLCELTQASGTPIIVYCGQNRLPDLSRVPGDILALVESGCEVNADTLARTEIALYQSAVASISTIGQRLAWPQAES